jgi:hypothetical protein
MGTYHTFFVSDDRHLDELFPGWKPPKPERVAAEAVNPFTKQKLKQVVYRWEPVTPPARLGKPNLYDDTWGPPTEPVVVPGGEFADYARSIEAAGAPGLRALPHFRAKNLFPFYDFDAFVGLLLEPKKAVPPARIGDDADDDVPRVFRLPREAARRLLALDDAALRSLVERLLVETDLAESGDTGKDDQSAFIEYAMIPLLALCREAEARGGEVCMYYALHY